MKRSLSHKKRTPSKIGRAKDNNKSAKCECALCKQNKAFLFPKQLLEDVKNRNVIIFAGAGISTENRNIFPETLYEDVAVDLKISSSQKLSFPNLMSKFCERPNGRRELLTKIQNRFDYVSAFSCLYDGATSFHRELSTIFQLENIITTNWDDYFERECAAIPFVTSKDFALWSMPRRKVFKIHGSINNIGSIVATKEDYERCYKELTRGSLGASLKAMLSTKTIVYVGYSLTDDDFLKIRKILSSAMGDVFPHSYIVTLDESPSTSKLENTTKIITSGQHFLRQLKDHLVRDGVMISESIFDGVNAIHRAVLDVHLNYVARIAFQDKPEAILTAAYQDGLIHAFQRMEARKMTGEYSNCCHVSSTIRGYEQRRKELQKRKRYLDIAYLDGYQNALFLLVLPKRAWKDIPILYLYGAKRQPHTVKSYERMLGAKTKNRESDVPPVN